MSYEYIDSFSYAECVLRSRALLQRIRSCKLSRVEVQQCLNQLFALACRMDDLASQTQFN
jgi:hypothetical protein